MTRSQTVEVVIPAPDDLQEYLIAELMDLDFEGFVQEDDLLRAYVRPSRWNDVAREMIETWLLRHGLSEPIVEHILEPQNWNRAWEETIRPVSVPPFVVKPTWASLPEGEEDSIVLEIDPKMSFGTGYHETTRLMLRMMPDVIQPGDSVLDAGTGTGILAIAALKLGARSAVGFDIDEWAYDNANENALINSTDDRFEVRIGGIDVVEDVSCDVILANINLNVLIEMMQDFREKLSSDGRVLLSGVLATDRPVLLPSVESEGFEVVSEAFEGEWWAMSLRAQ